MRSGGLIGAVREAVAAPPARTSERVESIVAGVRETLVEIEPVANAELLHITGPLHYVAEQATLGILRLRKLPRDRGDDVVSYVQAALQEYVVSLVGEFDVEHFEAWIAAQDDQTG